MIRMKKKVVLGLLAGVLAASLAVPSYAASRKPIKSIALTIKANIQPDTDFGQEEIEIESNSNKYSVDGYDILNDDFEWRDDSVPRIQITLTAEEDYYFQSLPKDKITLKGRHVPEGHAPGLQFHPAYGCGASLPPDRYPRCGEPEAFRQRHCHLGCHQRGGKL